MVNTLWLTVPAYIATIFLVYHSYRFRGGLYPTLGFFGSALLYGIIRENLLAAFNPAYNLTAFIGWDIWIGLTPLTIPVGWAFTAYTSWWLSEYITGIDKPIRSRLPIIASLGAIISATISFLIEMPAVQIGWWTWNFNPAAVPFFYDVPLYTLAGWAFTVFVFLACYFAFAFHKSRWRYIGIIGIALHFAQLIILNTILTG